ncbi:MAG TPA: hypothetical protein EYP14_18360 [Planctomycetaceae bacterium]|nr:hypothetical protein [Planctomycetaceae bacterium]
MTDAVACRYYQQILHKGAGTIARIRWRLFIKDVGGNGMRPMHWTLAGVVLAAVFISLAGSSRRARADFPFLSRKPDGWYQSRAAEPVSTRQKYYKGKYWPPYSRPTGPELPWIHRFHGAHYWPYPYNHEDRFMVRELIRRQVANGWVVATTLYDYHFDPDTDRLSRSGRIRLRWILENAPTSRRVVFVQAGERKAASQSRLESVKKEMVRMVGSDEIPPVMLRVTSPLARPAKEVRAIRDAELQSQPEPRITDPINSGSSGEGTEL